MVKITLEFEGVEQAIVALGKLGGIPAAAGEKPARKGRDDKGQPRGQYKPRAQDGTAGAGAPASTAPAAATAASVGAETKAGDPVPSASTSASQSAAAPVVPSPSDVVKAEIKAQQVAQGTGFPEPTVGEKDAEVQAAIEAVYGKLEIGAVKTLFAQFGIDRARNLPKSKKADFLAAAKALVA
jgi:hypothetical protein